MSPGFDRPRHTTFDYNAGRPVGERHDRSGITLAHGYDQLGRRVRLELAHGYDQLGRRVRLELAHHGDPLAAWEYGYDPDGRITRVVDPVGGKTRLAYDRAGRLAA